MGATLGHSPACQCCNQGEIHQQGREFREIHKDSYVVVAKEYRNVNISIDKEKSKNIAYKNTELETTANHKGAPADFASCQVCIPLVITTFQQLHNE